VEIRSADQFGIEELTELWNRGFDGYFVPMTFTRPQLGRHLRCGGIDLSRSVVAVEVGAPVAFSLLGSRGDRGWIGGMGVVPERRRAGLGRQVFRAQMERVGAAGLSGVALEVITRNWARRIYEAEGFAVARRLSVFRGVLPPHGAVGPVTPCPPREALEAHVRLHQGAAAAWNRSREWLSGLLDDGVAALLSGRNGSPTGLLVYRDEGETIRVLDAAAEDRAAGEALLGGLSVRYPFRPLVLVNEPDGSAVHAAMESAGVPVVMAQHEMHWSP
jgi:GNAT superfamily N-acetyltransferase